MDPFKQGSEIYARKLLKSIFKAFCLSCKHAKLKSAFSKAAFLSYSTTQKYKIFLVLKKNRDKNKSTRLIFSALDSIRKINLQYSLDCLLKDIYSGRLGQSSEYVHKMTSFRIQSMLNSLSHIQSNLIQSAFVSLKFNTSLIYNDLGDSIPGGTFQTSSQARSVLLKSENLCKRVNSLADKFSSHYISQESCESVSSRVNLHIPRTSLSNTPLSPLSMGELDTDRISNQIGEAEAGIAQYDMVLKVWRGWTIFVYNKKVKRENNKIVKRFYAMKAYRKTFVQFKKGLKGFRRKVVQNTLARGSYVQRTLRKAILFMKRRVERHKEERTKVKIIQGKKLKRVIYGWKRVAEGLGIYNKKVRSFRSKFDKRAMQKYFKYFAIMSMIISREKRQRKIAEDYNRERLLKIGFLHLSLSTFTNKYFDNLEQLAVNHYNKFLKKVKFDLFYVNVLMSKRIRIVKSTGLQMYRKNFLIKGMRRLYSFYSLQKQRRIKQNESANYYSSNLYLKTFVSWQNYHNLKKKGESKKSLSSAFCRKKRLKKCLTGWKKWYPYMNRIRLIGEGIIAEKNYWIMKDLLLEWTIATKKRQESRIRFANGKEFKRRSKFFNAWKSYMSTRLKKREKNNKKIYSLQINIVKRIFKKLKALTLKTKKLQQIHQKILSRRSVKLFSKWRLNFLRKIHLTPIIVKRYCKYIFQRFKKYTQSTSLYYRHKKIAIKHRIYSLKSQTIKKWKAFLIIKQKQAETLQELSSIKNMRVFYKVFLSLKAYSLKSKVKLLKLQKCESHYCFSLLRKAFSAISNNGEAQASVEINSEKILREKILNSLTVKKKKDSKSSSDRSLDHLYVTALKAKGIFRWFNYVKTHKTNTIHSYYIRNIYLKTLSKLKRNAENKKMLRKADKYYYQTSLQKGISRWSSYYLNYLSLMRKAKIFDLERLTKRKGFCLKKWLYVSHLNSWKNRAEKRLFFYWDRRFKRILCIWRKIVNTKYTNFTKIWDYRSKVLKTRAFNGLKMQNSLLKAKSIKNQKSLQNRATIQLNRTFRAFKIFHEHSRKKLNKLTKALHFRYSASCSKFFALWESVITNTKSRAIVLKKCLNSYIRQFGMKKSSLTPATALRFLKESGPENSHLISYFTSLQNLLPIRRNNAGVSIFLKWRSLAICRSTERLMKWSNFYKEHLLTTAFSSWLKAVQYAKVSRKTLRAAIIFHRTKLKQKAFFSWKPKKILKRRK